MNCNKKNPVCKLKIWVKAVIERDGCCVRCGSTKNLEAHHMGKTTFYNKNYFKPDSGVTLCRSCHDEFHNNAGYYYSTEQTLKFIRGVKHWDKCYNNKEFEYEKGVKNDCL